MSFKNTDTTRAFLLGNTASIINAFVWYFCAFAILADIVAWMGLTHFDTLLVWSANFGGAVVSSLISPILAGKISKIKTILICWALLGIVSSFMLVWVNTGGSVSLWTLALFLGVSVGLGMPICVGYYSDSTLIEKRARFGGLIMLANFVGTLMLLSAITSGDILIKAFVLGAWRTLGLLIILLIRFPKNTHKGGDLSYGSIISQRSFLFYFIPWTMFSLVNSLSLPIQTDVLSESLLESLTLFENILAGVFAVIGGFLSDIFGRKRIAMTGFVMLGLAYAILGIYPENLISWYFYTVVDGVSWGMFYAIFFMAIWGDLAFDKPNTKYYALGGFPYLLSGFLRMILGSYLAQTIQGYAIFSFTAFFLFLAVIPLMYAPETLPEKKIRDRELKQYIDKAKKTKEKYT